MKSKLLSMVLALTIYFGASAQVSYEEFKATYKPHYEQLSPNWGPVTTYNGMGDGKYGVALLYLYEESLKDSELQKNIAGILTSSERAKVAKGLKELGTEDAVKVIELVKDYWQIELMWFVDRETYQNMAPSLPALKNWVAGTSNEFFKKDVGTFGPLYAGIGFDLGWSPIVGLNTYVNAYNGHVTKVGPDGNLYTLSNELNEARTMKGFTVIGGFKLSKKAFMDASFQRRSAVASGGGEAPTAWTKDIKFSMNTFNLDFMWMKNPQFISFAQGFGLQYNIGSVKDRANFGTDSKYVKVGENMSNLGVKYKMGIYVNPEKLPVMFGVIPYWQMNVTKMDFSSLEEAKPQLGFGGGDPDKLKSLVGNVGVQIIAGYKFGRKPTKKEYPTFEQELMSNMDKSLNTVYGELLPMVTPDGKTMYFVRDGHPLNTYGAANSQDIWVSDIIGGITNATAVRMSAPFNDRKFNSIVGVSPDENTLIITNAYKNGVYQSSGYSKVYRTKTGWSNPEAMDIKDYKDMTKGSYVGANWTQDGKHLLMSFSESSTDNLQDIYVSHLQEDGSWSRPLNLGKTINTAKGEHSPFLASDGKTLYFSTNREGGSGDYDIWFSKRLDDSWTNWSKPENMGTEVNTPGFDAYYTIDAKGEYAYMVSSDNSKGKEDIVRIKLKQEVKPDPVVLITGKVYNAKTNEPLEANIAYNGLKDGKNYGIARTNPSTGGYKIVLPYGVNYDFSASAANFIGVSETMDLTNVGEYKEIVRDLYLVPIEVGSTIRLNNIFFEFGKASLKEESFNELKRVADLLKENPKMTIELSGHTDNVGADAANKKLSQERAAACKTYLESLGVDSSRLKAVGYGKDKPVADNGTDEGKAMNRRVEFTILTN